MGKKNGKGKFYWSDSSMYSGNFYNNNIHGNIKLSSDFNYKIKDMVSMNGVMEENILGNGKAIKWMVNSIKLLLQSLI